MVHGLNQAVFRTWNFENLAISHLSSFQTVCFRKDLNVTFIEKKLDYLYNCSSEIATVCSAVEGHCL